MAEEVQKMSQEQEVVVVTDVPEAEKTTPTPLQPTIPEVEKESPVPVPETEEEPVKAKQVEEDHAVVETDQVLKTDDKDGDEKVPQSVSFKEESNKFADLLDSEKKALQEFKQLVQEALNKHEFSASTLTAPPKEEEKKEEDAVVAAEGEKKPEETAEVVTEDKENVKPEGSVAEKEEKKIEMVESEVVDDHNKVVPATATASDAAGNAADDDGAKTVEAIEETIVAVSSSAPTQEEASSQATKESEAETKAASTLDEESKEVKAETPEVVTPEEVSIWGIHLLADDRSDVILLKFLRARDFKVKEAFTMLKNTIHWRKEFGIQELLEQDLGCDDDLGKVVFMHGLDKEGHPVCYNVYGEFQNKELYKNTFSDEEKRQRFLRWRIQFLERSIRKLDFCPGGISTIVQVYDLKNSPGPGKRELRQATKQALQLLQDNYPEFVAKQIFINVPWWYLTVNRMISPFLTQRSKSKFVLTGPSKSAETLLRYTAAEQIPVKYGGLSKDGEFGKADAVTEITVKSAAKHTVEFPVSETCLLTWEVRVVGWDVSYGAEFVPSAEDSYTVIIQKARKVGATEEPVVCNSFKIGEPGKVVLTINNTSSKKKKLLYRLKAKASSD